MSLVCFYSKAGNTLLNLPPEFGLHTDTDVESDLETLKAADNKTKFARHQLRDIGLKENKVRSLYWGLYLTALDEDTPFLDSLQSSRENYENLLTKYNMTNINSSVPSTNTTNINKLYNEHKELAELIQKDIDRLFPKGATEFFEIPRIRNVMRNILMVWGLENPEYLYQQGMHELLVPIIYLRESESIYSSGYNTNKYEIHEIFNPIYLEHDCYLYFKCLIDNMKVIYNSTKHNEKKDMKNKLNVPPIMQLCNDVNEILSHYSHELVHIFNRENIDLNTIVFRWSRLLFVRDFEIDKVIDLWDYIFAELSKDKYTLIEIIKGLCGSFILSEQPVLIISSHNSIMETFNNYPLDFPFSQIMLHAKYILQKKTLDFLVHVLVKPNSSSSSSTSSNNNNTTETSHQHPPPPSPPPTPSTTTTATTAISNNKNNNSELKLPKSEEIEIDEKKNKISYKELANQLRTIREELYKKVNGVLIKLPANLRNDEVDVSIDEDFEKIRLIENRLLEYSE